MHEAQKYLGTLLAPISLNLSQSDTLRSALEQDGNDLLFSSLISILEALVGISERRFSWATIKLYYGTFYALRAWMAFDGHCIFYAQSSPRYLFAAPGQSPLNVKGNTHEVVRKTFADKYPRIPLLSQPIGLKPSLEWLNERRESANYKIPRFADPSPPDHMLMTTRYELRQLVDAYLKDENFQYTFDPDHAMVAFPLRVFLNAYGMTPQHPMTPDEIKHLRHLCQDRRGPLNSLLDRLNLASH